MANLRLLCVTAHPDDESGGFGGSLLLYQSRGVETYVVCLTAGEAATHRGGHESAAGLAMARRMEFSAACGILQVTAGEVLDYPDGRLDRADWYGVVGELVLRLRRIRPQVVITFGPEGAITAHADHGMASVFATLAFQWAGRTNRYPEQLSGALAPHRAQKLYYSTATFTLPGRQPVSLAPPTTVVDIGGCLEGKIRAFQAHTTQAPLFPIFEGTVRQRGHYEMFHLAASARLGAAERETDLFAGVTTDS
jgi:LmbE family N-acetylglucosaminyl deacetylase